MKTNKDSKTKKNKQRSIIDVYETIYSVDIVVANKHSTLEQLKKLYVYSDGCILDEQITEAVCTVSTCKSILNEKDVVLVKYNYDNKAKGIDLKADFINTICHEAGHVTLDIYNRIRELVDTNNQEMFCYLLGYAGECIYKTLTKK